MAVLKHVPLYNLLLVLRRNNLVIYLYEECISGLSLAKTDAQGSLLLAVSYQLHTELPATQPHCSQT